MIIKCEILFILSLPLIHSFVRERERERTQCKWAKGNRENKLRKKKCIMCLLIWFLYKNATNRKLGLFFIPFRRLSSCCICCLLISYFLIRTCASGFCSAFLISFIGFLCPSYVASFNRYYIVKWALHTFNNIECYACVCVCELCCA